MTEFVAGQRWICDSELDLGLGTVIESDFRTVQIRFPASGEIRTYAKQSAPLRRASFPIGDSIEGLDGKELTIENIIEQDGLLRYEGTDKQGLAQCLEESQLNHNIQLNRPFDRLLSGQVDENKWFELRINSLIYRQRIKNSPLAGLYDARTSLIPHQLYITQEVAKRFAPRVLLADEVGLGKTIEACLIMQQQLVTGRAKRVLIVLPDALLHQWLVELIRRFNLRFSILDDERCAAIEESTNFSNPFESEQLVLCTLSFLTSHKNRLKQAVEGRWDLIIVDEAHHLHWQADEPSDAYVAVEQLSKNCKGLLLLTATPEQLGKASHFARLRLLDPQRFHDYQIFLDEENHFQSLASVIDAILDGKPLTSKTITKLSQWLGNDDPTGLHAEISQAINSQSINKSNTLDPANTQKIIDLLLDRHGTGRVLFRNSRRTIKGFPNRVVHTHPMDLPKEYAQLYELASQMELNSPTLNLIPERLFAIISKLKSAQNSAISTRSWSLFDPRVNFLMDFLTTNKDEKVLVICASSETAKDLGKFIRNNSSNRIVTFHEDLTIIERDRAASFFADFEAGAQALICSEIGSEGRNFQFSNHLILFDLPLNPDLLEQRIGRLDRIGQNKDIQIHVPFFQHSPQETMLRWYNEGLNAFTKTCQVGDAIFSEFESEIIDLLQDPAVSTNNNLDTLINRTQQLFEKFKKDLEKGRDRLLELNSYKSDIALSLQAEIFAIDHDPTLQNFMEKAFDVYGVEIEEHKQLSFIIKPGPRMQSNIFHGLNEDGNVITYDRNTALANENMQFISWNHPYVNDAIDLLLTSENGNTSLVALKTKKFDPGSLIIETIFVPEVIFPEANAAGISLSQQHIHMAFNAQTKQLTQNELRVIRPENLSQVDPETAATIIKTQDKLIKLALRQAEKTAENLLPNIIQQNQTRLTQQIQDELDRLISLKQINPNIREEEIDHYTTLLDLCRDRLASSKIRLDAIRIVVTH